MVKTMPSINSATAAEALNDNFQNYILARGAKGVRKSVIEHEFFGAKISHAEWIKVTYWLGRLGYSVRNKFYWVHPHYTLGFAPKPVTKLDWQQSKVPGPIAQATQAKEAKESNSLVSQTIKLGDERREELLRQIAEPLGDVEHTVRIVVPHGIKVLVEYE